LERKARKASLDTPKIIIDDLELKKELVKIRETTGENLKTIVKRLVKAEFEKLFPGGFDDEKPDRINKQRM
jgi:hypothetical protein